MLQWEKKKKGMRSLVWISTIWMPQLDRKQFVCFTSFQSAAQERLR